MEQVYLTTGVEYVELKDEVRRVWAQIGQPGLAQDDVTRCGIDLKRVPREMDEAFSIKEVSGLDSVLCEIIVTLTPVFAEVSSDLWKHIILPRLKARFGEAAINEKQRTQGRG